MNRLSSELHRLYFAQAPQGPDTTAADLLTPEGRVRALVLEIARPADWRALSIVWEGVQTDLDLPAPGVAISGVDGCQLWFSLAQPVPAAQAMAFLDALRARYLGEIPPERVALWPAADASAPGQLRHARPVPALQAATGHWSAFVSPDLAPMFADDPWLDLAPSPDAQADLLSRLDSIPAADFESALARLRPAGAPAPLAAGTASAGPAPAGQGLDPKGFLLAVMNDPAVALPLRIEAAKALLPYTGDGSR